MKKERNIGADIIRYIAFLLVICIHFFLYTDFYNTTILGKRLYLFTVVRCISTMCVPLFLMLTGYLMNKEVISKRYYKKKIKIVSIYILASLCCEFYKIFVMHESRTFFNYLSDLLSFTAAPYGWYIEMYLGLVLLIPFLNIIYRNLSDIEKKVLIISFLVLTFLPSVINVYNFNDLNLFISSLSPPSFQKILPEYWTILWPISYYFLGCYLAENRLKLNTLQNAILFIIMVIIFGSYSYCRAYNFKFLIYQWNEYKSLFVMIISILFFNLIVNIDFSNISKSLKKIIICISNLTLCAYLVSWIFDDMVYSYINSMNKIFIEKSHYFFVAVLIINVCSLILSFIVNRFYLFLKNCISTKKIMSKL